MAVYEDVRRALQEIVAPQLGEVRGDIAALRAEIKDVRADVKEVRADMDARFAEVRAEIKGVRSDLDARFAEVRKETSNIHTDIVRLEQVFTARLQTVEIVERVARLEERLARA